MSSSSGSNYQVWVNVRVSILFIYWVIILKSSSSIISSRWKVVVVDAATPPIVPCFFIFGDSLSDGGNNNNIISLAKANFLPYGIDFPGGPRATGRFGNGRMTVDFISEKLGLPGYRPPFYKSRDPKQAMLGVNYASGSAGILAETGNIVVGRIRMDKQLQNHEKTISRIKSVMGANTTNHLNKCLYSVWVGSNDWMLNYFVIPTVKPPPRQFSNKLVRKLSQQFEKLYQLGSKESGVIWNWPSRLPPYFPSFRTMQRHRQLRLANVQREAQETCISDDKKAQGLEDLQH